MDALQKIVPHLWFDRHAEEAAGFYASIFPDSRVLNVMTLPGTPSGEVHIVNMDLFGQRFQAISAGPMFKFNPAISFFVSCESAEEVDSFYETLSHGGLTLMPLSDYSFSARYVWFQDKYGVSWQLSQKGEEPITQRITPMLMFVGEQCGKAEEAMQYFSSIFPDSQIEHIQHYAEDAGPDKAGTVLQGAFRLAGQRFTAIDSSEAHDFSFNEAISLIINCDTQAEIDHYWEKLSADPTAEQCGWLKDRFGISWQVVPTAMEVMMLDNDTEKVARVTEAMLQMKKFDLAALQQAYEGV